MKAKVTKEKKSRRGAFSKALRRMSVGGPPLVLLPGPGAIRHPHQTIYYHNQASEKEGGNMRWSAWVDEWDVWRVKRVI